MVESAEFVLRASFEFGHTVVKVRNQYNGGLQKTKFERKMYRDLR